MFSSLSRGGCHLAMGHARSFLFILFYLSFIYLFSIISFIFILVFGFHLNEHICTHVLLYNLLLLNNLPMYFFIIYDNN